MSLRLHHHADQAPVEPLARTTMVDIACGIARARDLWEPFATHDPRQRQPVRLLATETYEVWVIGWAPGQGVDMHDHGGSAGVLVVTEGELTERSPDEPARTLATDSVQYLPTSTVHEISNVTDVDATSIHVYSPPLVAMGYYDEAGSRSIHLEPVAPEVPAIDQPDSARALHPSLRHG